MATRLITITALTVLGTGCFSPYAAPVSPPFGVISNIQSPLDVDFDETKIGGKRGESKVTTILFVAFGDASAASAAKAGGITTIRHADYKFFNVLGVYSEFTTVVYGD